MAGLFMEKYTACQSHWKSDFGWHRFPFSPRLIGKRVEKAVNKTRIGLLGSDRIGSDSGSDRIGSDYGSD